jgi:hypothetical protein
VSEAVVDLGDLGLDRGAHLLVKRALADHAVVRAQGRHPDLAIHLAAWGRAQGHAVDGLVIARGPAAAGRWSGAERAGAPEVEGVVAKASATWGLAARGALVEQGGPAFDYALAEQDRVWSDDAPRLYAQAVAAQWDPATAIPWAQATVLPAEVEDAVVQVMTYLIENETAALQVPARFVARIHPHYRETLLCLAVQIADEARHIAVFTRRALQRRSTLGLSTVGGQASLKTLIDEPDFALATFLLSVLGEGSFVSLLRFIADHAPDPVTAAIASLTGQDEARHVAFGLSHLRREVERDPSLRERLAAAVERRHAALQHTAGLNEEVHDALILLAAGELTPEAIGRGADRVAALVTAMDQGRRHRLKMLGFSVERSAALSSLHTRNFM